MGSFQLRAIVVVGAIVACAAGATAALADTYDDALGSCGQQKLEQPFAAFGDAAGYFMLPNGSFESGAAQWGLADGAAVVDDGGVSVLQLPRGSSATSAPVCITSITPTIRFFSRTNGIQGGAVLRVDALFKNAKGKIQSLPVGVVAGRQAWGPTLPTRLLLNAMAAVSKQSALGVAFRFTAVTGSWKVDRIYVDPLKECC